MTIDVSAGVASGSPNSNRSHERPSAVSKVPVAPSRGRSSDSVVHWADVGVSHAVTRCAKVGARSSAIMADGGGPAVADWKTSGDAKRSERVSPLGVSRTSRVVAQYQTTLGSGASVRPRTTTARVANSAISTSPAAIHRRPIDATLPGTGRTAVASNFAALAVGGDRGDVRVRPEVRRRRRQSLRGGALR